MAISILSPDHLPDIDYFYLVNHCDTIIINDNARYKKSGFQDRMRILSPQHTIIWNKIPLLEHGINPKVRDLYVDGDAWKLPYLKMIESSYVSHPHYIMYSSVVKYVISKDYSRLIEYNIELLDYLIGEFCPYNRLAILGSEFGTSGDDTDSVINACHELGEDTYVTLTPRDDVDILKNAGITVKHVVCDLTYRQYNNKIFYPNLSVLDTVMNLGGDILDSEYGYDWRNNHE